MSERWRPASLSGLVEGQEVVDARSAGSRPASLSRLPRPGGLA